jgi:hypothetical protein
VEPGSATSRDRRSALTLTFRGTARGCAHQNPWRPWG